MSQLFVSGWRSSVTQPISPASPTSRSPLHNADALSDYDNALGAVQSHTLTDVGTGAAIGLGIGCAAGLVGLAGGPVALVTVLIGCGFGATIGMTAGIVVAMAQDAAAGPDLMHKCQLAMPAWACQDQVG